MLSVAFAYRIGESTAYAIIKETTEAIVNILFPLFVQPPSAEDYKRISSGFFEKWNFPHCLGAFDGKHCVVRAPFRSGSLYYNYKKTFSVVLMAACDYNYKFILVDVGSYGGHNDASVFSDSEIGRSLKEGKLNIPRGREKLPGSNTLTEYFFVADEGFPLSKTIMRPYSGRNLEEKKKIFNYRLSRARRVIENAFGILVSRWRVLRTIICMQPDTVDKIILSAVCLHNFLKSYEEQQPETNKCYCPPGFVDTENDNGNIINGAWRENNVPIPSISPCNAHRATVEAYEERNKLADYFVTEGQVPWQLEYVRRGQNRDEI